MALGLPIATLPVVVQFNKQDLPNALPPVVLTNSLSCHRYKTLTATANSGQGVFDTLKAIINGVVTNIQKEMA
jgi:hypothetical protein